MDHHDYILGMTIATDAVAAHVDAWNRQSRSEWIALFSADMVFEDPVGTPPKVGLEAVHATWDRSFAPGRRWTLHPAHVVGAGLEAAVMMINKGDLAGRQVEVHSIEIFTVDATGRIVRIRSFFDQPTDFALANYFTPDRRD